MKIKFKNLGKATLPQYANPGDAGMDITCTSKSYDEYGNVVYGTDLVVEIPEGYVCLLFPRSSNSKKDLLLSNAVGILDSGYRGPIFFKYKPSPVYGNNENGLKEIFVFPAAVEYEVGDRVGQMLILPYPKIEPEWADQLSETIRGDKGWGSSGN